MRFKDVRGLWALMLLLIVWGCGGGITTGGTTGGTTGMGVGGSGGGATTAATGGSGGGATTAATVGSGSGVTGSGGSGGGLSCGAGKMPCGGMCVDTANDPANCGGCGNVCSAGMTCAQSVCAGPPCVGTLGFPGPPIVPVGNFPEAVAVRDLNGDGNPDLVVASPGINPVSGKSVSLLIGNGDGTVAPAVSYAVGPEPVSVAIGDLNGDGKPDLAVANQGTPPAYSDGNMSVLLNTGNGAFGAALAIGAGESPFAVAEGDLNGDGKLDLAVANYDGGNVSVLFNTGNGTFTVAVNYVVGATPDSLAVADLNGDATPDLVVVNHDSASVSVLLNSGNGIFAAAVNHGTGKAPYSVAVADLNGDGKLDLAIANSGNGSGDVSVLLSTGSGTFASARDHPVGVAASSVAIGDLDGDGRPDFLVVNYTSSNVVSVLFNACLP